MSHEYGIHCLLPKLTIVKDYEMQSLKKSFDKYVLQKSTLIYNILVQMNILEKLKSIITV